MTDIDKHLVNRIKAGSESAFAELYDKYWEKLYFVCYSRLNSREETEDILQELFVELWNRKEKLNIRTSVAAYLFTALKYKIFRLIDFKNVRKKYLLKVDEEELLCSSKETDEWVLFEELYGLIEQNIEKLPPKCKLIFRLSRSENLTASEISSKLKISQNTVENQITKAKKIIRIELKKVSVLSFF